MSLDSAVQEELLSIVGAGLSRVDGAKCVEAALEKIMPPKKLGVVAIGKAAPAMLEGAFTVLGRRINSGLLITKAIANHLQLPRNITCHIAGHPVPNEASLQAGQALVEYLKEKPVDFPLLFLISGGASALVEVPKENVTLSQLQSLNKFLLNSGLDIIEMNAIRQQVSKIKAGGLLNYINAKHCWCLLMSDVVTNDVSIIGSGLLTPASVKINKAVLPEWVKQICEINQSDVADRKNLDQEIEQSIIADLASALSAMASAAKQASRACHIHNRNLTGNVEAVANDIVGTLNGASKGIHLWGGETTIEIGMSQGKGGRNTHLALLLASKLRGIPNCMIAAIASDGDDGNSGCAGAIVDGETLNTAGIDKTLTEKALNDYDSASLLEQAGALLHFAPGRSNIADLVVAIKH